jgi:hypothetical protein
MLRFYFSKIQFVGLFFAQNLNKKMAEPTWKQLKKTMNPSAWRTEVFIGLMATIVSGCALAVSVYQSFMMKKQLSASVWPHLEYNVSQSKAAIKITLSNKGIGPAIVEKTDLKFQEKPIRDFSEILRLMLNGNESYIANYSYSKFESELVISPNEEIVILELNSDSSIVQSFLKNQDQIYFRVDYRSIFDEKFYLVEREKQPKNN